MTFLLRISLAILFSALLTRGLLAKPNVVLIMADDVGWEAFGSYGGKDYKTPNIDGLARKGVKFAHCYSTPICTTSRVQLMTGQYNFRNYTHFTYLSPEERTFGHLMKDAGYATCVAGKWQLNGLANKLPGWDDRSRPNKAGFDEYMLWQLTKPRAKASGGGERFWSPPLESNGEYLSIEANQGKYGPDMLCDFVCDFIERKKDEPFFVYYPMVLVHNPFVATPDTIGDRSRGHGSNKGSRATDKQNFVAMVNYMDKIVGRIVDKVDSVGQLDNTIIMFTADNGTNRSITSRWENRDVVGGKGTMLDTGTHVPFVAYWKGHSPEGRTINDLVDFTDFFPTLAEAAGVKIEAQQRIDGNSFLPQLKGEQGRPRNWMFCHYQPYWGKLPGQFARTQRFKLYRDGRFFDITNDMDEARPIAATANEGEAARKMLKTLLDRCPPAPTEKGSRDTVKRPVYPNWNSLK